MAILQSQKNIDKRRKKLGFTYQKSNLRFLGATSFVYQLFLTIK